MKTLAITFIAAMLFISANASAARYEVVATVVDSYPAPMDCHEERDNLSSSPLVGAIAGGLAGRQFGGGSGRNWATAAGAIVGASVASSNRAHNQNRITCRNDGYLVNVTYISPVTGREAMTTKQSPNPLRKDTRIKITVSR